jgi:hypothetical protein
MTDTTDNIDPTTDHTETTIDKETLEAEIIAGARAYGQLLNHSADDWTRWGAVILGLRGLRDLAFAKAHTTDMASYKYRQEFGYLLKLKKYSIYDQIDKPTRSDCYKLMDSLDEINIWYAGLPAADKLRWKHPQSIRKHAPRHLIAGGMGDNRGKAKADDKRKEKRPSPEVERLRQILFIVLKALMKHEPELAQKYLDQIDPEDPNDSLDDI